MKIWLVDTGPLVAYLDAGDPDHRNVSEALESFTGRAITTPAVVTEAMYFVGGTRGGARALAQLVDRASVTVYDVCQVPDVHDAAELMDRYRDTPMDFADATLVLLAELLEVRDVFTLDRRGFATYRTRPGTAFHLVLDGAAHA